MIIIPNTSVRTIFHLTDEKISGNSSATAPNNSDFGNIDNLLSSNSNVRLKYNPFFTLEHNINVLDGSLEALNNLDGFSYFSKTLSSDNGATNDVITINFESSNTLKGLTFVFGINTFLDTLEISYLNNDTVLNTYTIHPNKPKYLLDGAASGFNKINIKFTKTRFPRMFTRLQKVYYGLVYEFEGTDIVTCSVSESVNPLSIEVNPTKCEMVIYSENNEFDLMNPNGFFSYLKRDRYVEVFARYNGREYEFGKYNLDTWESLNAKEAKFNMSSNLDKLNNTTYYDGWYCDSVYSTENTYSILDDVMDSSGVEYEIDNSLESGKLMGLIPLESYKNVLQLICFCSSCAIDDTRDGKIKFYKIQKPEYPRVFSNRELFDTVKITRNEQQTKILFKYFYYDDPPEKKYENVANLYLKQGERKRIFFTNPASSIRYKKTSDESWHEVWDGNLYYYDLEVSSEGGYEIEAKYYDISNLDFEEKISDLQDQKEKEIKIESARLIYPVNGNSLAGGGSGDPIPGNDTEFINNIKNYYLDAKLTVDFEFVNDGTVRTGEIVRVETDYGEYVQGYIIEQNIDLSGGMVSKAKLIGKVYNN